MADIFEPILSPIIDIGKGFVKLGEIVMKLLDIFGKIMKAIPNIFEPSKLIDDILYGVSYGINRVFDSSLSSVDPEDNPNETDESSGPFGVKRGSKVKSVCVPPTLMNTIFLLLCPPLAVFMKTGLRGIFSVIVCGILCVKFYYFPGLLFAALHVLCV